MGSLSGECGMRSAEFRRRCGEFKRRSEEFRWRSWQGGGSFGAGRLDWRFGTLDFGPWTLDIPFRTLDFRLQTLDLPQRRHFPPQYFQGLLKNRVSGVWRCPSLSRAGVPRTGAPACSRLPAVERGHSWPPACACLPVSRLAAGQEVRAPGRAAGIHRQIELSVLGGGRFPRARRRLGRRGIGFHSDSA